MEPVVWALDAFSKDFDVHFRTAEAIRAHAPQSHIHPVYVLSEDLFKGRGYSSFLRPALKPRAHRNLLAVLEHEVMSPIRNSGFLRDPEVLVEASSEAHLCVGKLLRYAKSIGARMVGLGTHSRSKFSRWFAGSFTETLLNQRAIDVLVTGPRQRPLFTNPGLIVAPTSFTSEEHKAFARLLAFAHAHHTPLKLLRRESEIPYGLFGESWLSMFDETAVQVQTEDWLAEGRESHVELEVIAENFRESQAESVIDYAKSIGGVSPLIAMLELTPLVKDLIRTSPFPLLMVSDSSS